MKSANLRSIRFNFIMNSILTMSSFIFPLISFPYVSRILMPEGMGKVTFAISVISYFAMFAQLGIPTYGIRTCAKIRDNKEELTKNVQEIFIINIIMSFVAYIAFFIALSTVPRLQESKILFLIVSSTILFNTIGVEWLYKALEQYAYITIRSMIFKFVALIAMFALIHQQSDYVIYGGISILAAVGSNLLNFINVRKYIGMRPVGNYNFKKHMKPIFVFFAMSMATTVYTNLDKIMLGFIKNDEEVGYYYAAVKIKMILVSIVTSLGTVILPRASFYIEHGFQDEFLRITQKTLNFVIILAAPLTLYFMIFARSGIFFLSGNAYEGAVFPMQVIMPTLLFIGMTNIMGIQILVPKGKEKVVLFSVIAGAIVNLIINIILIPNLASTGAAIGTLVAEIVVFIAQYIALKDIIMPMFSKIHYKSILLGLVLATLASIWVMGLGLSNFFTLAISSVLFFAVYASVLNIFKEPFVIELKGQVIDKYIKKKNDQKN
ncbi:flippase [Neobacillus niacini]|uniref:flippase n=1 Tax=Neobacillus niacini TaxID=86668 RepID=UPI002FFF50F0